MLTDGITDGWTDGGTDGKMEGRMDSGIDENYIPLGHTSHSGGIIKNTATDISVLTRF